MPGISTMLNDGLFPALCIVAFTIVGRCFRVKGRHLAAQGLVIGLLFCLCVSAALFLNPTIKYSSESWKEWLRMPGLIAICAWGTLMLRNKVISECTQKRNE